VGSGACLMRRRNHRLIGRGRPCREVFGGLGREERAAPPRVPWRSAQESIVGCNREVAQVSLSAEVQRDGIEATHKRRENQDARGAVQKTDDKKLTVLRGAMLTARVTTTGAAGEDAVRGTPQGLICGALFCRPR